MATSLRSGDDREAEARGLTTAACGPGPDFGQVFDLTRLTSVRAVRLQFSPGPHACLISWRSLLRITIVGLASNPVGAARG